MPCTSPYKAMHGEYLSMVRCGKCRYCKVRRKQAWVGRLRLEAMDHTFGRFITLTYTDENRPETLDYLQFQEFMKRYRYYYGECRFFAVGEYGEKSGHAHWHALIFGHPQQYQGHWPDNKAWEHGYSYDGYITPESIGYVAGYALKASVKDKPNITRMSLRPGIGFLRLERFGAELASTHRERPLLRWPGRFALGGRRYPLCEGGLIALQRGFLDSGGLPPVSQTPDERHWLALDALSDWGNRIESERNQKQRVDGERTSVQKKARERL